MEAYVTLVATEAYASGTLVLSNKLRDLGSKKEIVCMVTPNISSRVQDILSQVCTVIQVDLIRSADFANLELLGRPDLDISFTKIQLWRLTQYKKLVFLDADAFPLRNIDELFDRPCFSAAPDSGWPDCFNSGVFVTEPSESTYQDLIAIASKKGSFDGGDQGLLNTYFSSWPTSPEHRLPFTFNTTPTTQYGYAPAHNEYGRHISIIHFIGENKPWKYQRFADGKVLPLGNAWEGLRDMIQSWWDTWDKFYGRTPPYHLLSGNFEQKFDDGFQTRPIVPFDESVCNAWDNQDVDLDNERRQVQPMPPLSNITIGQPEWLKEQARRREEEERNHKHEKEHQQHEHHEYQSQEDRPHQEHHHEEHHHHHEEPKAYSMVEWDPAHQSPPNMGSLGADIPDLSSFKNVWDKPRNEQHDVWVAPVHQHEPQIMTKPEYSHYNADDYEPDRYYLSIHTEFHPSSPAKDHWHQHEEQHHHEEYHHRPEYPPSLPWDHVSDHFPPPTRVWLDESTGPDYCHQRHSEHQGDNQHEVYHDTSLVIDHHQEEHLENHAQEPETSKEEQPKDLNPQQVSDQALFAIDQAVSHPSMQSKLDEFIASLNTEDNDISDRDLIPINFKPTSRLQTGMYTPSPSGSRVNSRSGSRRASVSSSRRASVSSSRRNSIITSSPTRKLSLNTVIPNSVAATTTYQVPQDIDQSSKLFATASASIFRKTPYTSASVTPALARTPDEYERHDYFYEDDDDDEEEDDFLASEQNNGSDFLFDHQYSLTDQLMTEPVDSLVEWDPLGALNKLKEHSESMVLRQSLQEALVKTAQQQQQQQEQEEMVTASDDNKLLGMIQAEEEEEKQPIFSDTPPLPSIKKIKRPTAFKSSWDDEEYELPSALASGESTPRTPIARRLSSSDLTKLLALEKERFRQQRASLKMAEPQAAVASMLEAELDLSRGLLFQRRHHYLGDSDDSDDEMQATLSIASNEPRELLASGESDDDNDENQARVSPDQYAAYYDEHVILEAQKRLRALVTGEKLEEIDSMPLPFPNRTRETVKNSRSNTAFAGPLYNYGETRSADPQPFSLMYNSRSYHANFGFDENRKLQIYRSDLLPTDEWMEDMKTLNPEIIVRKNNPIEKQKLAKEKEEVEQKFKEERVKEQRLNILAASKENVSATVTNAEIPEAIDTSKGAITQESTSSASANLSNDTMNDLTNNQMFSTTANAAKKQNETTLIPDAKNKQQLIDAPATNTKKSNIEIASTAILDKPNDSFTSRRGASLIATTNKIDLEEIQDIVEPTTDEMKQKTVQNTFDSGPNLVIDSASLVFETAATGKAATKDCIVETKVSEQNSSTYALSATKDAEETGFDTAKPISLHSTLISFTTSEPAASITPTLERFSAVTAKTTTPLESSVTTVADSVTLPVETSKSITEKSSNSFSALTSHKSESSSSSMTVTRTTSSSSSTTTKTNSSSSKTSTKAKRRNSRRKSAKSSQNQAANK